MSELDLFLVMGSESVFSSRGGFGAAGCESGFGVVLRQRVGLRWQVLAGLESELFLRQQERLRWWQLTDLGFSVVPSVAGVARAAPVVAAYGSGFGV